MRFTTTAAPAAALALPLLALSAAPDPARFEVREGYKVTVAIDDLRGARFMEFDDRGTLYISRPGAGDIVACRDENRDGVFETRTNFIIGRSTVHAMCFRDGWMWFAQTSAIAKARDTNADGVADEIVEVLANLPGGPSHWWRSLLVTDEHIYTSVGDSGNITDERKTDRQKVWRYTLDGSGKTLFCEGIRNTEELRLRPGTREVWGFDHGSDWFGKDHGDNNRSQPITDLIPPDELNRYEEGKFYGHPFIVGKRLPRPEYTDRKDIHLLARSTVPPEWEVGAHWAVNGFTFIDPALNTAGELPEDHEGDIFFAAHGSWNSSDPVGYCIGRVLFDDDIDAGHPYGLLKIVSCLDEDGAHLARPVDVIQAPDGSLYFSSDDPGCIYRITHESSTAPAPASTTPPPPAE